MRSEDKEAAIKQLKILAKEQVSKSEMLADAESRIENRLNEFLLPKLIGYPHEYRVEFIEMSNAIEVGQVGTGA